MAGGIPAALGNLGSMGVLRLDGNRLTGSIPPELGNPEPLTILEARFNRLAGCIPPELRRFRAQINPQGDPDSADSEYDLPDCDDSE